MATTESEPLLLAPPALPERLMTVDEERSLFMVRMRDTGKLPAFQMEMDARMQAVPKNANKEIIRREVMSDFGFLGGVEEYRLAVEKGYTFSYAPTGVEEAEKTTVPERFQGVGYEKSFAAAVSRLPRTVAVSEELEWIGCHPKMREKHRRGNNRQVRIKLEDILDAPSQRAVNRLHSWANNPEKYEQTLLTEEKKKGNTDDGLGFDADGNLEAVRKLIAQVKHARGIVEPEVAK